MSSLAIAAVVLLVGADALDPFYANPKPYSQQLTDNYNQLKYTGWQGPYSDRRGVGLNRDPPLGCRVDQVVSLNRHGERWPDKYDEVLQGKALAKLTKYQGKLNGSLEFVNEWVPFASGPEFSYLSQESLAGPYSGLLDAYTHGVQDRRRYGHLWDGESVLPIFASGYERIVDTARHFGQGFLGWNYTDLGALNIIPETANQGANSLVPSCPAIKTPLTLCPVPNATDAISEPDSAPWVYPEFARAARRLRKENPSINIDAKDIPQFMATAAFELNIRGSSPWASVFTSEEWIAFEYLQSSLYYCYYGPGSTSGKVIGSVFLNATRTLLLQGPEVAGSLFFNFAHDTDIIHLVTALGFATPQSFDPSSVQFGQPWDVTDLTPQGARIYFERLVCDESYSDVDEAILESTYPAAFNATGPNATYASNYTYTYNGTVYRNVSSTGLTLPFNATSFQTAFSHNYTWHVEPVSQTQLISSNSTGVENVYVRVVLNEAVVPLPGASSGPGKTAKLSEFDTLVNSALEGINFAQQCGVPESDPQYLSFFWDWNTTTANDAEPTSLPYQVGLLDYQGHPI